MDEPTYDIQELVDLSGVSRRNVHFYVQQGVLPPPEGAGLAARYAEEHLMRLRLIPLLRREGLRLDQIRDKFEKTNSDHLRRLLERQDHPIIPAPAPSINQSVELSQPLAVPRRMPQPFDSRVETCRRYDLPGGMILIVPESLSADDRLRLERILEVSGIR